MSEQADRLWEKVAAFADGELPAEECCALLKKALDEPTTVKRVEYQQQLRKLMAGCMDCEVTLRCPEELKKRLEGIAEACCGGEPDASTEAVSASAWGGGKPDARGPRRASASVLRSEAVEEDGVFRVLLRWLPLAAAAALFVAASGVYLEANREEAGVVLVSSDVRNMELRHVRCGSGVSALHMTDLFPERGNVAQLPAVVVQALNLTTPLASLDLSSVGYAYVGAGLCNAPGGSAVHILYAHTDADSRQRTISLWVQNASHTPPAAGSGGNVEVLADKSSPHPVLHWSGGGAGYYLVGDAMRDLEAAREVLSASE